MSGSEEEVVVALRTEVRVERVSKIRCFAIVVIMDKKSGEWPIILDPQLVDLPHTQQGFEAK